jgi:hypothetical protein
VFKPGEGLKEALLIKPVLPPPVGDTHRGRPPGAEARHLAAESKIGVDQPCHLGHQMVAPLMVVVSQFAAFTNQAEDRAPIPGPKPRRTGHESSPEMIRPDIT